MYICKSGGRGIHFGNEFKEVKAKSTVSSIFSIRVSVRLRVWVRLVVSVTVMVRIRVGVRAKFRLQLEFSS